MHLHRPDADDPTPPFEQLRSQVALRVAAGELAPGTRLPTVRALAAELGLAAGTVARAYRELEADGVVVTEGRHGTFVAATSAADSTDARAAAEDAYAEGQHQAEALKEQSAHLYEEASKRALAYRNRAARFTGDNKALALLLAASVGFLIAKATRHRR